MSQGPRDRWDPSALPFAFFHTSKRGICQARPKSQDNCERLSCKTARPDKSGHTPDGDPALSSLPLLEERWMQSASGCGVRVEQSMSSPGLFDEAGITTLTAPSFPCHHDSR
jgi:hypothetical protein